MRKSVFTTGDVAAYCGVSADTVSRWFDLGQIEGYRLGPAGDRRIPREKLREFMLKHGIPVDRMEGEKPTILVLDDNPSSLDLICGALRGLDGYSVVSANTGFECGLYVAECNPQLILMELELSDVDPRALCVRVKGRSETRSTAILGMGRECPSYLFDYGFDGLIQKPFTGNELLTKTREMLSLSPGKINRPKGSIAV